MIFNDGLEPNLPEVPDAKTFYRSLFPNIDGLGIDVATKRYDMFLYTLVYI
jgi:hypothetical protein